RSQLRANQLQCNRTVQLAVHRLVHRAHAAFAQKLQNLVATTEHVTGLQDWSAALGQDGSGTGGTNRRPLSHVRGIDVHHGRLGIRVRIGEVNYRRVRFRWRVRASVPFGGDTDTGRIGRLVSIVGIRSRILILHDSPGWVQTEKVPKICRTNTAEVSEVYTG